MKFLYSSPNGPEVGLLQGLLQEEGIACEIRNESTHPNLPGAAFQPEIWVVHDDDYEKACVLRDAWSAPAAVAPTGAGAGMRVYVGLLLLLVAGILGWQFARLAQWGSFAGVLILFGLTGAVALLSAMPWLSRRKGR